MKLSRIFGISAVAGFLAIGTASAGQIAQISELVGLNDFVVSNDGLGTVTLSASSQVGFTYSGTIAPPTVFGISQRSATLTFNAVSTSPGTGGAFDVEPGFTGSFMIIDNLLGTNLLSGMFSSLGTLSGNDGGGSATFSDSTNVPSPNEVVFTSDYLDFSMSVDRNFSISLSNFLPVPPGVSLDGGGFVNSGTAALTGTFAASPLPRGNAPEPATMGLLGSALIGLGLIGRKRLAR